MNGKRGFTDYSTVMHSGEWRSGFRASRRAKGLAAILGTAPSVAVVGTLFLAIQKKSTSYSILVTLANSPSGATS
ncbi:hypothetical protein HanIR_Chr13g0643541 [Helianthus annuus]|nr:hypothetical protein HanIR_Chr13g0643541 [Helianthus annuus]